MTKLHQTYNKGRWEAVTEETMTRARKQSDTKHRFCDYQNKPFGRISPVYVRGTPDCRDKVLKSYFFCALSTTTRKSWPPNFFWQHQTRYKYTKWGTETWSIIKLKPDSAGHAIMHDTPLLEGKVYLRLYGRIYIEGRSLFIGRQRTFISRTRFSVDVWIR